MKGSLISVIVPIYNGEKFIPRLLDSFMHQEYKEFELVIVDDGSEDNTYSTLMNLKKNYPYNINVIHQENRGVSAARNVGIDSAKGDYLCFCDVDDLYHPAYLKNMHQAISENDVKVAVCKLKTYRYSDNFDGNFRQIDNCEIVNFETLKFLREFLFLRITPVHYCLMIERCLIDESNVRFAEGYKYGEDYDFSWRILAKTNKIAYVNEALYFYVWQPNSAMARFDESRFDSIKLYSQLEDFIKTNKPNIAEEFNKYWKSRSLWATVRLAANKMSYNHYRAFIKPYNVRSHMKNLISFPDTKVAISSFIYCVSPLLFYYLSRIISLKIQ